MANDRAEYYHLLQQVLDDSRVIIPRNETEKLFYDNLLLIPYTVERFAYRLPLTGDDLADFLITVRRCAEQYDPSIGKISTLITFSLRNCLRTIRRRLQSPIRAKPIEPEDEPTIPASQSFPLEHEDDSRRIEETLLSIGEVYANTLRAVFWEGRTQVEIGYEYNITHQAAGLRVRRAIQVFREHYNDPTLVHREAIIRSRIRKLSIATVACQQCGTSFPARISEIKRGGGKFCSRTCGSKYNRNKKTQTPIDSTAEDE